jgi:nitrogen fixation NifU-like protein
MSYKDLYHERLLDYFHHPRKKGTIEQPDFSTGVHNPSCGDSVTIQGIISQEMLVTCRFQAQGCVISGAAASLLMEYAEGKSLKEILGYTSQTMLDLVGLSLGPTRIRCALLALEALQAGIASKTMSEK